MEQEIFTEEIINKKELKEELTYQKMNSILQDF